MSLYFLGGDPIPYIGLVPIDPYSSFFLTLENWRCSRLERICNLNETCSILGKTIEGVTAHSLRMPAPGQPWLSEDAINIHFYPKSKYSFDLCPPRIYIYYLDVEMIFMGIVSGELFWAGRRGERGRDSAQGRVRMGQGESSLSLSQTGKRVTQWSSLMPQNM